MKQDTERKTYNKPKVRIIELRAEETLDRSCIIAGGGPGFGGGTCGTQGCFTAGS